MCSATTGRVSVVRCQWSVANARSANFHASPDERMKAGHVQDAGRPLGCDEQVGRFVLESGRPLGHLISAGAYALESPVVCVGRRRAHDHIRPTVRVDLLGRKEWRPPVGGRAGSETRAQQVGRRAGSETRAQPEETSGRGEGGVGDPRPRGRAEGGVRDPCPTGRAEGGVGDPRPTWGDLPRPRFRLLKDETCFR